MAKLDTTVENIQLKSNMLTSGKLADLTTSEAKEAAWTDAAYPSAKAVADKISAFNLPIGSVLITSTNTSPATNVGGTWALIDKEYSSVADPRVSEYWTPNKNGTTDADAAGFVIRTNHLIDLTLQITTKTVVSVPNNSQITLGTINHSKIGAGDGIGQLLNFNYIGVSFANAVYTNNSTTESCIIKCSLGSQGEFSISDIYNTNRQLPVGTTIYVNVSVPMRMNDMSDSFCNKFYWKRTA
jgi:hypothetical protein